MIAPHLENQTDMVETVSPNQDEHPASCCQVPALTLGEEIPVGGLDPRYVFTARPAQLANRGNRNVLADYGPTPPAPGQTVTEADGYDGDHLRILAAVGDYRFGCILDNLSIEPICVPNHPETEFDEGRFLERLRGSIALARDEKFRIIAAIPKLSQSQIDQVSYILKEERAKLSRLPPKHLLQLQRLEQSYAIQWQEIVDYFHKVVERKLPSAP